MLLNVNKYLSELKKNADYFERIDINGKVGTSFLDKYFNKLVCALISALLIYFMNAGFSDLFISFAATVLSILIGLFITSIIFSFDKIYKPINEETASSREKLWNTQAYNYSKQFAFITGYNIVLCIFTLIILSLSVLFKRQFGVEFNNYFFEIKNITFSSIFLFVKLVLIVIQRFLVFYWILRIIYNTLFVVSSLVKYMSIKIGRENDTN